MSFRIAIYTCMLEEMNNTHKYIASLHDTYASNNWRTKV